APRARVLVSALTALRPAGHQFGTTTGFTAWGARGAVARNQATVLAAFEDQSPAVFRKVVARGRVIHFNWLPGLSYAHPIATQRDLPTGFSAELRRWITLPAQEAQVIPPVIVDQPLVETPLLLSPGGAAVTLLNWSGGTLPAVTL